MLKARHQAWQAGTLLLTLLGLGGVAVPVVSTITGKPGGLGLLVVGLLPLILAVAGLRSVSVAIRLTGSLAALILGAGLVLIATSPLRGLTPPPGAPAPSIEPVSMLTGLAFIVCAILLAVGVQSERP